MSRAVGKYGFINAKLRARISKGVSEEQFQRMIQAADLNEAIQVLENTAYSELPQVYHETGDMKMAERVILEHEIETVKELKGYLKGELIGLLDRILEQYEIELLKDALRYWFDRTVRKREVQDGLSYLYKEKVLHDIDIHGIIYADSEEELLDFLEGTPYRSVVEEGLERMKGSGSLYHVEIRLEELFFTHLKEEMEHLQKRDREIAERIIGIQIDMENITRIGRFLRFYSVEGPGETETTRGPGDFLSGGRHLGREELSGAISSGNPMQALVNILSKHYSDETLTDQLDKMKGKRDDTALLILLSMMEEIFRDEVRRLLFGYPFTVGIILAYCFIKKNEIQKIIRILNGKFYGVEERSLMESL